MDPKPDPGRPCASPLPTCAAPALVYRQRHVFVADARAPASGHRISAGAGASWLCADACDPGLGDVECTLDADRALSWTPRTSDGSSRNGHAFGCPPPSRPGPDPHGESS